MQQHSQKSGLIKEATATAAGIIITTATDSSKQPSLEQSSQL
jgi:hypothetical protein